MSEHTPGPWTLKVFSEGYAVVSFGEMELGTDRGGVDCGAIPIADARLIAAAPELLEACRHVFRNLHAVDLANNQAIWRIEKHVLKAAIAKAEGR